MPRNDDLPPPQPGDPDYLVLQERHAIYLAGVRLGLAAGAAEAKRWGDTTMTQFREGPAADVAGFEDAAEMAYQVEAAIRALDAEDVARGG